MQFFDMFKLLADILVNNFDRLPLCWKNDGNPDNILVVTSIYVLRNNIKNPIKI